MTHVDTPQTRCQVGVARGDITPPVGIYHRMWGAATHDRATGVHRPLLATLLWLQPLEQDSSNALLIIALDHCVMDGVEMTRLREAVSQATGLAPSQIQISLSHTHGSGWMSRSRSHLSGGDLIGPYLDSLADKLSTLAAKAKTSIQSATIVYGTGHCNLAAQRDFFDRDHQQFVCGFNPEAFADDTVMVARVTCSNGKLVATIVNYACHPTTLAWENTSISPDYVGAMREVIEQATQAPCVFLQGASGDLGPREGFVGDHRIADRNGRQLGYASLSTIEALPPPGTRFVYTGPVLSGATLGDWRHQPLDADAMQQQATWIVRQWSVDLSYRHDLPTLEETKAAHEQWTKDEAKAHADGDALKARDCRAMIEQMNRRLHRLNTLPPGRVFPYRVNLWRLGDAYWLFVPGELYQSAQVTLRARFPKHPIVFATLTGDWQPGYLPAASAYGYGIYQETIACISAGSLELLIESIAREIGANSMDIG
jgi:neutral/alkaline ceramidase-like enzyme